MELNVPKLGNLDWRARTLAIAWVGAAICGAAAIIAVVAQISVTETTLLAIPVGLFLAVLILPFVLAGMVFLSARLQERGDRSADSHELSHRRKPGETGEGS